MFELHGEGRVNAERMAIVLWTPAGSSIRQDGGRDAQYLSEATQLPVLAIDHPGGGLLYPREKLTKQITNNFLEIVHESNAEALSSLGHIGVDHVIQASRSGGGPAAVAATYATHFYRYGLQSPKVAGLYVAETASWESQKGQTDEERVSNGELKIGDYTEYQVTLLAEDRFKETPDLVHPQPHGLPWPKAIVRKSSIYLNSAADNAHNKNMWALNYAQMYAMEIAKKMVQTSVRLDFAEHSLVTSSEHFLESKRNLFQARFAQSEHFDTAASIDMEQIPNTLHSSFDNRDYYAERISLLISAVRARLARR